MKWWNQMPWSWFSECWTLSQLFHSLFHFQKRLFHYSAFCHKSGVICTSEVTDISPGNLDSSLCFFQPSISHAYKLLNKEGDDIQPWHSPFSIWNQNVVPCPLLTVASWPAYRFLKRQVRWSSLPISFRIFHSLLWSTLKVFGIVNKAEVDVFSETLFLFLWSSGCWQFDLWLLCLF